MSRGVIWPNKARVDARNVFGPTGPFSLKKSEKRPVAPKTVALINEDENKVCFIWTIIPS